MYARDKITQKLEFTLQVLHSGIEVTLRLHLLSLLIHLTWLISTQIVQRIFSVGLLWLSDPLWPPRPTSLFVMA